MSKPRKKKHSIHKRHAAYSRALLHRLSAVIVWIAGQNGNACVLVSLKTGNLIAIVPELAGAISEVQHDWSVFCAAFGRRQDGEEYMKAELVEAPRCYQSQIADQLNNIHIGIMEGMNPAHRCGLGWIGCPWGADLDETQCGELFDRLGAWSAEKLEMA